MTKTKAKKEENNIFSKDLAYRFSTLLVAGCYLIMRFVITDAKVIHPLVKTINTLLFSKPYRSKANLYI
jgi:hypothetical protein